METTTKHHFKMIYAQGDTMKQKAFKTAAARDKEVALKIRQGRTIVRTWEENEDGRGEDPSEGDLQDFYWND